MVTVTGSFSLRRWLLSLLGKGEEESTVVVE